MNWFGLNIDWDAWPIFGPNAATDGTIPTVAVGWRYRCQRCDVIGYSNPQPGACWYCDQTDQLVLA